MPGSAVVRTGARASALQSLLNRAGYSAAATALPPPRLVQLSATLRDEIDKLYRALGGTQPAPRLQPGPWDLTFDDGLVVELDEELHFNRYRKATLDTTWTVKLPWQTEYLKYSEREAACLAAARWGKRWTNPSCEQLFGSADEPGTFDSGGAPRWKQRALYDAIKDAAALCATDWRLTRLATVDIVNGVRLGAALGGRDAIDLDALREFVANRSTTWVSSRLVGGDDGTRTHDPLLAKQVL